MSNILTEAMPAVNAALLEVLGDSITYTAPAGTAQTVTAVVSDGAFLADETPGIVLRVEFRSTDIFAAAVKGAVIAFAGGTYCVQSVEVDRYGWVKLGCTKKN